MKGQGWLPGCISCFNDIEARHFLDSDDAIRRFIDDYDVTQPYNYCQAGTILINIPEWLKNNRCIELIKDASTNTYMIDDQDAINKFFHGEILFLDPKWNAHIVSPHLKYLMDFMPAECVFQSRKALTQPALYHWAAHEKPWNRPYTDKAHEWWEIARKTLFYEQIIYKNTEIAKISQFNLRYFIKITLRNILKSRRIKTILKKLYYNIKTTIIKIKHK